VVGNTSEADEKRFIKELPLRAEGEKGLPLRAELDVKSGGLVGGGSLTFWPGSPLMSMVTTSSSPPPGGFAHLRAWLAVDVEIGKPSLYPPVKVPAKHQTIISLSNR
jgi:hypothetical protein